MSDNYGITRENLLFTLPPCIKEDASAGALADALAQLLANRLPETDIPCIFPTLDKQDEAVIDILANDLKVDWYNYDEPIDAKRSLVRGSVLAHKKMGTVFAVKSVVGSLYPDSDVEEWFDYGGENGYFRININVTHSAETGAVQVYPPEEIKRRIETVKRFSTHLESVSYMVKRALTVGRRIESWLYRVPECGTIYCGTYWEPSTLGHSEQAAMLAGAGPEAFLVSPEFTGTLPQNAVAAYTVCGGMVSGGSAAGYTMVGTPAGETQACGTLPEEA